jgi:uncharacterized protein (DUF1697 family)
MNRYIAFLRAVNVGGHNVKMDKLKQHFEEMGFKKVETFIASGNVIFDSKGLDRPKIENTIEKHLFNALGYEVATFLRTFDEIEYIIKYMAFPRVKYNEAAANNIGFMKNNLNGEQLKILRDLETEIDDFHSHQSEVYWLCKKRQSQSTFSGNLFEKKLKTRVTFRGIKTLQKMLAKHS